MKNKGFTLIELIVVIAIIAVLSAIILFSITQYINRGKDSNILGSLAVLVPAGEVYYNSNGSSYYANFCDSTVVENTKEQMPENSGSCYNRDTNPSGVCCSVTTHNDAWAACAPEFADSGAYCVDSRGVKKEINVDDCKSGIVSCN